MVTTLPHFGSTPAPRRRTHALKLAFGLALCAVALTLAPRQGAAVLISTGDGTGNTTAPASDPGFDNIGVISNLSGVYVRNGWVLTANHVGENPITLGGTSYDPIPGSGVQIQNADSSFADLLAFKLYERAPLPDLAIASDPPTPNTQITIIGNGRNRGAATSWMGLDGWNWGGGRSIRWGTNRIEETSQFVLDTESFSIVFDNISGQGPNAHEADVVTGDSGGAAFAGSGGGTELIGILFARATFDGQPASTSLHGPTGTGNIGYIADLHHYRDDILALIDQPDCSDGLDEDRDGLTDYPADPGCTSPTDTSELEETLTCDNGIDDDGDGLTDYSIDPGSADPGCASVLDSDERGAVFECDNGIDDDDDQLSDYPDDSGCLHPTNWVEAPEPGVGSMLGWGVLALCAGAHYARERNRSPGGSFQASSSRSTR
ncbi:MAG: hypothetical protein CL908_10175 [Deltaproteobacteria bacterium]|nr:hypothetical protein [Deltaproteobacteria bacterium]